MAEAAIDTGLFRDLYVALGDPLDETTWIMRLYYKPFISWLWGGCLIMAGGGLLALFDRRYRAHRRQAGRNPAPAAAGPYTQIGSATVRNTVTNTHIVSRTPADTKTHILHK